MTGLSADLLSRSAVLVGTCWISASSEVSVVSKKFSPRDKIGSTDTRGNIGKHLNDICNKDKRDDIDIEWNASEATACKPFSLIETLFGAVVIKFHRHRGYLCASPIHIRSFASVSSIPPTRENLKWKILLWTAAKVYQQQASLSRAFNRIENTFWSCPSASASWHCGFM